MRRGLVTATAISTLLAAGLVVAPPGLLAGAGKDEKRVERRVGMFRFAGGRLGVRLADVGKEDVERLKLKEERGALVKSVEKGSPAEEAGIEDGDVILRYHGENVLSVAQLARLVRETPAGRGVTIEISRGGTARTLSATIGEGRDRVSLFDRELTLPRMMPVPELPEMPEPPEMPEGPKAFLWEGDRGPHTFLRELERGPRKLGIRYQEVEGQLARFFKVAGDRGVLVTSVDEGGPAGKAGLKAGDVILRFDGRAVEGGDQLRDEVRRAEGGKEVTVTVLRDGKPVDLQVQLASPDPPRRAGGVSL